MPRGKVKYYPWENSQRTITSLLSEKRIFGLVPGSTYASKRKAIRTMLESGGLTYDMVSKLPDSRSPAQRELYGSERRRANHTFKHYFSSQFDQPGQIVVCAGVLRVGQR